MPIKQPGFNGSNAVFFLFVATIEDTFMDFTEP